MAENTQNSNNYYILWDRYAKVTFKVKNGSETEEIEFERFQVENGVDSSPDFEIETEFDITESTNIAKIVIYNLTDEIIKKLKKGVEVVIEAGYWNDGKNKDIGVIYKGIIESLKGSWNNADKKFEITCNTYNNEYKDTKINLKAGKGTKASTIIKLILSKLDKLKAGKIELGKDIDYKDGKTLHNNVKHIFKELAKDTKSVFFITNGVVTFQPRDKINRGVLEFDPNRFQDVKENDGTYTLKAIFDHRFQEGFKINLDLKKAFEQLEIKGEYLITKGKHVMNFKTDAYTELEIRTKFDDEETKKANEIEIVTGKKGKNEKSSKKKKNKKGRKTLEPRWRRRMKLTPCIVSTFFMLPSEMKVSRRDGDTFSTDYLYDFADLLIVDEAGQVRPEIAGASFALAQKALVIGDTLQIAPIWSLPPAVDIGNMRQAGLLAGRNDSAQYQELCELGKSVASGSVMQIAQTRSRYHYNPELARGMFLYEHRRCFDEIIAYCNTLCYKGHLQPKRGKKLQTDSLPPIGYWHIDGHCQKNNGGSRHNQEEAEAGAVALSSDF